MASSERCALQYLIVTTVLSATAAGVHHTEHFRQTVNRFGKLPAIVDGPAANEFKLSESVAIFRYLIARDRQQQLAPERLVADHWYPEDLRQRAAIDEYLEWQHTNTREACSYYFILKYMKQRTVGREPGDDNVIGSALRQMEKTLDKIEDLWLVGDGAGAGFLGGQAQVSIADLLAAAELEQPRVTGYEPGAGRPKVKAWLERVRNATYPHYEEAHAELAKLNEVVPNSINPAAKLFTQ